MQLLQNDEDERLEFKEASNRYDFEELVKYCCALANEGGGYFILGITDKKPRVIKGTAAFSDIQRTKHGLIERLHLRIDLVEELLSEGRVLVFKVPARPLGMPISYKGAYWMRAGESLVPMTPDLLRRIFDEAGSDFTAEICPGLTISDLDDGAIEEFRLRWFNKSGIVDLKEVSKEQLLRDAELLFDEGVTYAALILLGTTRILGRFLAQAEVIFEYRSDEQSVPAQDRKEFRLGFFAFYEELWRKINLRNDVQQIQDGLFRRDLPTFNEGVVREALLNAICHRDYRLSGSIFIRQYPRKIEIVSPGGLLPGITVENILWRQAPRNRRLAEAFARCGLVERSGQGVNIMYEESIRESKPVPDFGETDNYQVALLLDGRVKDPKFIQFLEKVSAESTSGFTTKDLLVIQRVYTDKPLSEELKDRIPLLVDLGVIETVGRGGGRRLVLARKFYEFIGQHGTYTRSIGLDRETNKALLLKHIRSQPKGSKLAEFKQVLPALSDNQIQHLLRELKDAEKIHVVGKTKGARWFLGSEPPTEY